MSRTAWALRMIACLAACGVATALLAQAMRESKEQKPELRFFVLDKNGSPVDVRNWTGSAEVTPEHGTAKTIQLEEAQPSFGKEHSKAGEPDRYSESKDFSSHPEGADGANAESQAARHKDRMLCGEARKLEDGWVEMIVVWPKSMMQQGKQAYQEGKEALQGKSHEGFLHDHGAAYFRAALDPAWVRDSKTNTVNFTARVTFTTPAGDTKYVKGYSYPAGFIDGAIGHLVDKDFTDTAKIDHDRATHLARRVDWCLNGLPPLSFSNDKERQEYEKAREDAQGCSKRLEQATGKEIEKTADECKSALKEVRSQADGAQGVLFAQ